MRLCAADHLNDAVIARPIPVVRLHTNSLQKDCGGRNRVQITPSAPPRSQNLIQVREGSSAGKGRKNEHTARDIIVCGIQPHLVTLVGCSIKDIEHLRFDLVSWHTVCAAWSSR